MLLILHVKYGLPNLNVIFIVWEEYSKSNLDIGCLAMDSKSFESEM